MSNTKRSEAPYLRNRQRTPAIMTEVCIALLPTAIAAIWYFGVAALRLLMTAAVVSVAADRLFLWMRGIKRPFDGSALVTGLLLALSCPSGIPPWLLGSMCVLSVGLFREAFGGIGANLFNPAMASRALLITLFPAYLAGYALPDATSAATPLADETTDWLSLLFGRTGGSVGETSAVLILVGAAYLIVRRIICWQTPLCALAAFSAVMLLAGESLPRQLLSGSILFGAVYIITDYTTSPTTRLGEALFAIGFGALTAVLRLFGRYPEGVCFAVLIMNLLTPLLDRLTWPRVYGTKRKERSA